MELMNTTIVAISHAWTSLSTSLLDRYSFSGFNNDEIFGSSMWQIKPNSRSTTVYVNPENFAEVTSELTTLYGNPTSKGKNGQIFKCNMTHDDGVPTIVTITSYSTTAVLHVQGCLHEVWVDTLLDAIEQKVKHKLQINEHQPLNQPCEHELSVSFDAAQPSSSPPPLASTPIQKSTSCPPTCESKRLKDTIASLKDRIKDYKEQLSQFQELRSNYAHLSTSYRELSDRNCALQVELSSLKAQQSEAAFQTPRTVIASPPSPAPTPAPIGVSNPFSTLTDEVSDDALPSAPPPTDSPANSPAATNSPKRASKMEHVKPPSSKPTIKSPPHQPKPEIRAPPAEPKPSQILIFSNSICKRIDASRFYRGRTTKLYAESGATIAQIQRQVENCTDVDPKHVILQAWTNNVTRESVESVKTKARNLVNATLKKFPTARIIVSGILPRLITMDMSNAANDIIAHLNRTFAQNCVNSTRVSFSDHILNFVDRDGRIRSDLYYDSIHLNDRGIGQLVINLRKTIDSSSHPTRINHLPIT